MTRVVPIRMRCPKCEAIWVYWPKEASGFKSDTLQLLAFRSCSFCDHASSKDLLCARAQAGWRCSREGAHDGPCAAWPHSWRERLYWAWHLRSWRMLRGCPN